jgi:hypothetical protein
MYSHAIYLRDCQGSLACLTTVDQADGPHIARANLESFEVSTLNLAQEEPFLIRGPSLCFRHVEYNFSRSVGWDMPLPSFPFSSNLDALLAMVKDLLASEGRDGGLKHFFQTSKIDPSVFSVALRQRADALLTALRHQQIPMIQASGLALLGLGYGLTPSGDDFLASLITIFHLPGGPFPNLYRDIGRYWAKAAIGSTTSVGAFLVHTAAEGRARAPICSFITALAAGDLDRIKQTARETLTFGSMSGTDWMVGMIAGLELGLWLQRQLEKGG